MARRRTEAVSGSCNRAEIPPSPDIDRYRNRSHPWPYPFRARRVARWRALAESWLPCVRWQTVRAFRTGGSPRSTALWHLRTAAANDRMLQRTVAKLRQRWSWRKLRDRLPKALPFALAPSRYSPGCAASRWLIAPSALDRQTPRQYLPELAGPHLGGQGHAECP